MEQVLQELEDLAQTSEAKRLIRKAFHAGNTAGRHQCVEVLLSKNLRGAQGWQRKELAKEILKNTE